MTGEIDRTAGLTLPVFQEELHVGARTVDTGRGVRVRKTVGQREQLVEQTLMHDEITVRHVPIDKIVALSEAPASRYEGDTLIVPILEEVLVVEKRLRIKEEVHITRSKRPQRFSQAVAVKSEAVCVERFDEGPDVRKK